MAYSYHECIKQRILSDALRQLMYSTPDPWDWPRYTRQKVCRVLGVETRQYVVGSPEDPCR